LLNEKGIATPSGRVSGWKKDTVGQILKNKVYAGYTLVGGEHSRYRDDEVFNRVEKNCVKSDKIDAIVIERLWQRVANILAKRATDRQSPRSQTNGGKLSGILYCAKCGYALDKASRVDANGKRYNYYRCNSGTNRPGHHTCPQWRVREDEIVELIVKNLLRITHRELLKIESIKSEIDENAIQNLQNRLAEIETTKERAYERYLDDPTDTGTAKKVWERKRDEFDRQRDELEKQLQAMSIADVEKKAIGDGFRQKAMSYMMTLGEDHVLTQYLKESLGLKNNVEIVAPVCREQNLRAFLKLLESKVYLTWTNDGSRYYRLSTVKITANIIPNKVAADNAMLARATKRSA
jgi:hypothetical protein